MRVDELEKMHFFERTHWWFLGRRYLLRSLLNKIRLPVTPILDAGAGTGLAASELCYFGDVVALDLCPDSFRIGEWASFPLKCVGSISAIPFRNDSFDLVTALDVLEHVEDDLGALRELYRVCRTGGTALMTVPAYSWLWSSHDESLGHCRRYTRRDLVTRLELAGFRVRKASYAVSGPFIGVALFRSVRKALGRCPGESDLAPVPRPLNFLLAIAMRLEAHLLRYMSLPFGLSVLAIAVKPPAERQSSPPSEVS